MDTALTLLTILLSALPVFSRCPTNNKRDLEVVIELPKEVGRNEALKHVKLFVKSLAFRSTNHNACWRPRVRLADSQIHTINDFKCHTPVCITDGLKKVDARAKPSNTTSKSNVIEVLKEIGKEASKSDQIPGLDGPRKTVLLMVSSKMEGKESSIPTSVNILLEGGYDFIAVGIGEGRYEALKDIAFQNNRVIRLESYNQLNLGQKDNKNAQIFSIIEEPNMSDPVPENYVMKDFTFKLDNSKHQDNCDFIFDICFLIDSSGSIRPNYEYKILQEFVVKIANSFNISREGTHASAVVFSDRLPFSEVVIRLTDYYSNEDFKDAILNIPYIGYRTRIDLAFDLASNDVFSVANGARPHVSKVVFLLTDGKQNPTTYNTIDHAMRLRDQGVKIFAIGITQNIDEEQLVKLTGEMERMFYADTFKALESKVFLRKVFRECCRAGRLPPPLVEAPTTATSTTLAETTEETDNDKATVVPNVSPDSDLSPSKGPDTLPSPHVVGEEGFIKPPSPPIGAKINCASEKGYCIKANGRRQTNVKYRYNKFSGDDASCLRACRIEPLATGCEVALEDSRTCIIHTDQVIAGSGTEGFVCWIFSKCKDGEEEEVDEEEQEEKNKGKVKPKVPDYLLPPDENDDIEKELKKKKGKSTRIQVGVIDNKKTAKQTKGKGLVTTGIKEAKHKGPYDVGAHDVYINIFQDGSGPSYIMQGNKIDQSSDSGELTGITLPSSQASVEHFTKVNGEQLVRLLESALPYKPRLVGEIQELIKNSQNEEHHILPTDQIDEGYRYGYPSLAANVANATEVRMMTKNQTGNASDRRMRSLALSKLLGKASRKHKVGKTPQTGCSLFIKVLEEAGLLTAVQRFIQKKRHVVIFCPADDSFSKVKGSFDGARKGILLNHISVTKDKATDQFNTLYPGGKVILEAVSRVHGKVRWKANGVDVLRHIADISRTGIDLILIDDVIYPQPRQVLQLLKDDNNVSIFYKMMMTLNVEEIFKAKPVQKVCFTDDKCVAITPSAGERLRDPSLNTLHFSIVVPTNRMFKKRNSVINTLMKDRKVQENFVQEHILIGSLSQNDLGGGARSVSPNQSSLWLSHGKKERRVLIHRDKRWKVIHEVAVKEGTLYIVEEEQNPSSNRKRHL